MKLEIFLARRYMSSHRGGLSVITWIALAGVIVGVMSLVAVLAVMSGFEKELRAKILGNNAHILVQIRDIPKTQPEVLEKTINKIRSVDGVASAMPVIYGEGFILSSSGDSEGVLLKGVDPKLVQEVLDLKNYVADGNWKNFKDNSVILGESLANRLSLETGDSFTLILNRGEFSPFGIMPKMKKLVLSDSFKSGMSQFDSRHGYLPLSFAEELFETRPHTIEVRTKDPREIAKVKERIRGNVDEAISVQDWISVNSDFLSALQLEKTAMAVILGLIVLVAAFNICGSLIMIVRDKTKDIAILKSMGALDSSVLKVFFIQGMFIGIVGTIVGIIFGIILSLILRDYIKFPLNREVYMIDTLPVDLRISDLLAVAAGALLISAIATLYPARLAAKIIPTEGLKSE
ncbi:MAG: ABC transporter permease [Deltaproteobacteria bacterium]|nr:ABC transporter permease [Deltaproteobacteria bacterium]